MIKIQDSWCVIGLVFPQMVNEALVLTLEDWLWENVWSYEVKYQKEKNQTNYEWWHSCYPNIHS